MSEKKKEELPEEASVHESNKMVRVLTGRVLKYTNRVFLLDGRIIEFQTKDKPVLEFLQSARGLWLCEKEKYGEASPIMAWPDGAIFLSEENENVTKETP